MRGWRRTGLLAQGGALTTRALDAFRDCWRLTDLCVEDSPLVTQEWMAQLGGCLKASAGMMRQLSFRRCPRIIDHDLCTLGQYLLHPLTPTQNPSSPVGSI